jgi:streptogramin lyase
MRHLDKFRSESGSFFRKRPRGRVAKAQKSWRPDYEALEPRQLLATITEFPVPSSTNSIGQIIAGPNGNLYFYEAGENGSIGEINPYTNVETTVDTLSGESITGIAVGPDGNIWSTLLGNNDSEASGIGKISPEGNAMTTFSLAVGFPRALTVGPDGNMWFLDGESPKNIYKFDLTTDEVVKYSIPMASPTDLLGPAIASLDGNLWLTVYGTDNDFVKFNPTTLASTDIPVSSDLAFPDAMTSGPDGNLWSIYGTIGEIVSINPYSDTISKVFSIPTTQPVTSAEDGITEAPDGSIWFTDRQVDMVGELNTVTNVLSMLPVPTTGADPIGISAGPDGNIWFTEGQAIGVVNVSATPTPTPISTPTPTPPSPQTLSLYLYQVSSSLKQDASALTSFANAHVKVAYLKPTIAAIKAVTTDLDKLAKLSSKLENATPATLRIRGDAIPDVAVPSTPNRSLVNAKSHHVSAPPQLTTMRSLLQARRSPLRKLENANVADAHPLVKNKPDPSVYERGEAIYNTISNFDFNFWDYDPFPWAGAKFSKLTESLSPRWNNFKNWASQLLNSSGGGSTPTPTPPTSPPTPPTTPGSQFKGTYIGQYNGQSQDPQKNNSPVTLNVTLVINQVQQDGIGPNYFIGGILTITGFPGGTITGKFPIPQSNGEFIGDSNDYIAGGGAIDLSISNGATISGLFSASGGGLMSLSINVGNTILTGDGILILKRASTQL